ncbi:hypothetical protein [Kribbella flavida]|uniref:hypothetical protein n=1 Tax=Kribbella flavida TaxID=182640 RepID=UPI001ED969CB|nr:hypothetical protein [Kribbella flavida]
MIFVQTGLPAGVPGGVVVDAPGGWLGVPTGVLGPGVPVGAPDGETEGALSGESEPEHPAASRATAAAAAASEVARRDADLAAVE